MTTSSASRTLAWFRQFAKLWGFALFCILVVYIFREVVLPFLFAILVAYILAPLVARAGQVRVGARPFPRWAAVIILYVFILSGMGWFLAYFVPKLSKDFASVFGEAPKLFAKVNKDWLPRVGAWIDDRFGGEPSETADDVTHPEEPQAPRSIVVEPLPGGRYRIDLEAVNLEVKPLENGKYLIAPPAQEVVDTGGGGKWEKAIKLWLATRLKSTEGESRRVFEYAQKFIGGVFFGIGRLFLVLMVAAFILIDLERIQGFLRSLVPERYQGDYDRIYVGIDRGLSGVIRGQLLICLINGALTYIGLRVFSVKYPLLLAVVAAVMSLVPIFGSILSSFPIVAVALISPGHFDLKKGIEMLAWIILIHLIEANFLNPKIMGNAAKIHPVLVVFALIAGEHSYGLVGALFAVPVASIIQTIFVYYRRRPKPPATGATPPPALTPAI